ncbi:uracil-DNA glycosylase [Shewanella colwelliana]|uniref:Uracil-DNA glycosylase n=1 Tax=Shewanella colwelliana TaxID=23 RepID=A0A1E5ISP9_SHECO|nr:uracil-DNA glycosylase [Shewanella colwelliana]MDX1281751.1 uracil-DNA glycosylase [Shewanella colwelliana]OEG73038.1 uracil-DNA glycosylase [Shewanella colwelliana]GIU39916.1 uracil-DNA glycosylase [Shewanella colwelliana]
MANINSWQGFINDQQQQTYFAELTRFIQGERDAGKLIYPAQDEVFNAFNYTALNDVRVVLIGQDPYHGPGQAHGLCFSVKPGIKTPPSLVNMYKELATDIVGFTTPNHGYLEAWARQGVLMLNTVLTVEQGKAHSHAKSGWETFTDNALKLLNAQSRPIIFVLWGGHAIKKGKLINAPQHQVLSGPHPSPLSAYRGFFGCQHFSKINQLLLSQGDKSIDWQV